MLAFAFALSTGLALGASHAHSMPTPPPKPQAAEMAFISHIQHVLMAKYPTPRDAERAGYFRYTNEDSSGSISYANLHWTSNDWDHPSQLWYDVHGNLLGADFSRPYVAGKSPSLWGVIPARWAYFEEHVHYILRGAGGALVYGHATSAKKFVAAGGSLSDPQPSTLVKMHLVKSASQVVKVFTFPAIWDLVVWVKPNANGAFAWMNPSVHPSKNAAKSDM
jgi:hypothetical protein